MHVFLSKPERIIFFLTILFLPIQLGKHFWPEFSIVSGVRIDYLSPTLYLSDFFILLLIFVGRKKIFRSIFLTHKVFILFLLSTFLGVILSKSPAAGMFGVLKFLEMILFGVYVSQALRYQNTFFKDTVLAFAISGVFESFLGTLQFLNHGSLNGIFYFFGERMFTSSTPGIANASIYGELMLRPYATFPHPNVLAYFLLVSFFLLFFSLYRFTKIMRMVSWAVLCLFGATLFLTLSRTALLFFIVSLLVLFVQGFKQNRWLLIGFAAILIGGLMLTPIGARFLQTSILEEAVQERVQLLTLSWKLFQTHPLFGVGLSNLFFYESSLISSRLTFLFQPVHNTYLLLLAETGLIGFSCMLVFLYKTGREVFRKKHALALVLFASVLALGLFDHYFLTVQQGQLLAALVFGLCWVRKEHVTKV